MAADWLRWGRRLQALAQDGLTYATDPFDALPHQIARFFAHRANPARPTDFD